MDGMALPPQLGHEWDSGFSKMRISNIEQGMSNYEV